MISEKPEACVKKVFFDYNRYHHKVHHIIYYNEMWKQELSFSRRSHQRCSVKKVFLKNSLNLQENTQACNFVKKETLTQVLSCEFCEIFKNTCFYSTPPMAPSGKRQFLFSYFIIVFNMMNFLVIPLIIQLFARMYLKKIAAFSCDFLYSNMI